MHASISVTSGGGGNTISLDEFCKASAIFEIELANSSASAESLFRLPDF